MTTRIAVRPNRPWAQWAAKILAVLAVASESVQGARLFDTETPAYLELGSSRYSAPAGATSVWVTVIRSGDFRIQAAAECVVSDDSSQGERAEGVIIRPILFPAGRSFIEVNIPIPMAPIPSAEERKLVMTLTNPSPRTLILQGSAVIYVSAIRPPMPRLNVERASVARLILTWRNDSPEWVLEKCHDLQAGRWTEITPAPIITEGFCRVEDSDLVAKQAFYRLRQKQGE